MLKAKPERALLIKRWVIGMDVTLATDNSKIPTVTAGAVVELAEGNYLSNLTKFWRFWQYGPPEKLWTALQTRQAQSLSRIISPEDIFSCPLLKDVGVRRGYDLTIDPESSVSGVIDFLWMTSR